MHVEKEFPKQMGIDKQVNAIDYIINELSEIIST